MQGLGLLWHPSLSWKGEGFGKPQLIYISFIQTPEEEEILNKKRSKKIQKKYDERKKNAKISSLLEEQFQQGKLLGESCCMQRGRVTRWDVCPVFFPCFSSFDCQLCGLEGSPGELNGNTASMKCLK